VSLRHPLRGPGLDDACFGWKSASVSKSTATCRVNSDLRFLLGVETAGNPRRYRPSLDAGSSARLPLSMAFSLIAAFAALNCLLSMARTRARLGGPFRPRNPLALSSFLASSGFASTRSPRLRRSACVRPSGSTAHQVGNGRKPTSASPQPGCWIVAPFLPHEVQRARCLSRFARYVCTPADDGDGASRAK
jgi:hypothetical protein